MPAKNPVVIGWVVRAVRTKTRTRMVKGKEQTVRTEEVKVVSQRYTVRDAAEKYLALLKAAGMCHGGITWERAWVSPEEGYEE